jgi:hypothetical protein
VTIPKHWYWAALPIVLIGVELAVTAEVFGTVARGDAFLGALALLVVEFIVIGWLVNDRWTGAFIDNRNRMSLSKLQAAAWTAVVLAGLATAAVFNILAQGSTAAATNLNITIPGELLLAMGISATSLVATPGLLSLKADQTPSDDATKQAAAKPNPPTGTPNGKVATNADAADASWANLVTGDEVGNAGSPDLGKIQQLLITVLLLGCYTAYVFLDMTKTAGSITTLPVLDKSFVWLLGISHASYLAYKAAPHTGTQP